MDIPDEEGYYLLQVCRPFTNSLIIVWTDFQNCQGRAVSPKPPIRTDGSESHPYLKLAILKNTIAPNNYETISNWTIYSHISHSAELLDDKQIHLSAFAR